MSSTHEVVGIIEKVLGNNNYAVEISDGEATKSVLCHLSGKMRQFNISVIPGDTVTIQLPPPYDRGRIIFRGQKGEQPEGREARRKKRKR